MTTWHAVALCELLVPVSREETVEAGREYRLLGARWYAKGLYIKETKSGAEIRARTLYRVAAGDFVYNRLFAWKGSFAVASEEHDGCFVSNEFPCFEADHDRLDARFLWLYFSRQKAWSEALGLSSGSTPTSRNRLKEEQFLRMVLPLPPLSEQRRIVARIEDLAAKIEEARGLCQEAGTEVDRLLIAMAHRNDFDERTKRQSGWTEVTLGEVIRRVEDAQAVDLAASYPNLGVYSFGRGLFKKPPISGATTSAKVLYRVRSGQFIYSRLFAFEGAYEFVSREFDGYFVSGEYPTFDCDTNRVVAEFLYTYFKSPAVWDRVAAGSKRLGHRRQRVQAGQVLAHRLMLPPLDWQHRIAVVLQKLEPLRCLQAESAAELDALLPSILDKAFKGEL